MARRQPVRRLPRACAAAFDFNGTLYDDAKHVHGLFVLACLDFGIQPPTFEEWQAITGEQWIEEILKHLDFDLTDENKERMHQTIHGYERNLPKPSLAPGTRFMLKTLLRYGIPMALVTRFNPDRARSVIGRKRLQRYFGNFDGGRIFMGVQNKTEVLWMLAREFGLRPRSCVFASDTYKDLVEARAAGWFTVGTMWGFENRDLIARANPDAIIDAWPDLFCVVRFEEGGCQRTRSS